MGSWPTLLCLFISLSETYKAGQRNATANANVGSMQPFTWGENTLKPFADDRVYQPLNTVDPRQFRVFLTRYALFLLTSRKAGRDDWLLKGILLTIDHTAG